MGKVIELAGRRPAKRMWFDGPCPFLTCLLTAPHSHPVCPVCGAVNFGNLYCKECRSHHMDSDFVRELDAMFERGEAD